VDQAFWIKPFIQTGIDTDPDPGTGTWTVPVSIYLKKKLPTILATINIFIPVENVLYYCNYIIVFPYFDWFSSFRIRNTGVQCGRSSVVDANSFFSYSDPQFFFGFGYGFGSLN
jgi:hypothetical protein